MHSPQKMSVHKHQTHDGIAWSQPQKTEGQAKNNHIVFIFLTVRNLLGWMYVSINNWFNNIQN